MPGVSKFLTIAFFALNISFANGQPAGDKPVTGPDVLDNVVLVAGMEQVKPNTKGTLVLDTEALRFSNQDVKGSIPRARITNVFVGDERTEPWGTGGMVMRKVIPYGGGAALGAATNKKVDLLTVEFRDAHDAYHGVVFVLPVQKAGEVRDRINAKLTPPAKRAAPPCETARPQSVLIAPIAVSGVDVPAEYRILLYEQIVKQLRMKRPAEAFYRVGDEAAGPGCVASTLHVTITNFKKGNRAVRASTGPLGMFLGTTALTFDVDLQDVQGKSLFHAQIKKSDRSDSDSLGLADGISKKMAKQFDKALAKTAALDADSHSM